MKVMLETEKAVESFEPNPTQQSPLERTISSREKYKIKSALRDSIKIIMDLNKSPSPAKSSFKGTKGINNN